MNCQLILELAAASPDTTTVDRLVNVDWALRDILFFRVPGEVVELGCYQGHTSVLLQDIITGEGPHRRELHLYDSFEGLPEPGPYDGHHLRAGECLATVGEVEEQFRCRGLPLPRIHVGWFEFTVPALLPPLIAFAYVDCDFYDSVRVAVNAIWPRLAPGGVLLIDDYGDRSVNPNAWEGLPGVKAACDECLNDVRPSVLVGASDLSMAAYRKPLEPTA